MSVSTPKVAEIIYVSSEWNKCFNNLKLPDASPVYKQNGHLHKESYRPVNLLSRMSKIFEVMNYSGKNS